MSAALRSTNKSTTATSEAEMKATEKLNNAQLDATPAKALFPREVKSWAEALPVGCKHWADDEDDEVAPTPFVA